MKGKIVDVDDINIVRVEFLENSVRSVKTMRIKESDLLTRSQGKLQGMKVKFSLVDKGIYGRIICELVE